jgi:putative peptidoglycan lipid II flippase
MRNFWNTLKPLIFLPVIFQGNIAVERAVATLISLTAVSALDYAKFVTETLLLVVSTPVALAGLVNWGGMSEEVIRIKLIRAFNLLLAFALPISVFLAVHSELIVSTLFARGKFDLLSITVTSSILIGMSFGLWANVIGYVLIKGLNAQLKNKIVMIIMSASLLTNIFFNLFFYKVFKEMTLGISYSLSGVVMLIGCLYYLKIWNGIRSTSLVISISAFTYYLISMYQFDIRSNIISLIVNGVVFLVFWAIVILITPRLRMQVHKMINRGSDV